MNRSLERFWELDKVSSARQPTSEEKLHEGVEGTLAAVRSRYWPLGRRSVTRAVLRRCVTCFRAKLTALQPIMGQLSGFRLRSFLNCVPFQYKDSQRRNAPLQKCYGAIYVCCVTKAVHVELVKHDHRRFHRSIKKSHVQKRQDSKYLLRQRNKFRRGE